MMYDVDVLDTEMVEMCNNCSSNLVKFAILKQSNLIGYLCKDCMPERRSFISADDKRLK